MSSNDTYQHRTFCEEVKSKKRKKNIIINIVNYIKKLFK